MDESLVVRRETQVAAPPAAVFAFLTDPEKIMRWMGTEATTEAHPGGLYLFKGVGGRSARGAFREVVPVHRLAYSFGWEGNEAVPPGSSLIEIDLVEQNGGTLLRMTQTGLPNAATMRLPRARLGALPRQARCRGRRAAIRVPITAPSITGRREAARTAATRDLRKRRLSRYMCIMLIGIMLWFMLAMIHSEPIMISPTISTPKASASTLL